MTARDARDEAARGDGRPDLRDGALDDDRDAGDTHDELAGEDAQVRAMRSVWLAMRDEEPSSGGLAELMAAARGKAAEMAPAPSWWQRAVAGLRRPQVLAFATVLVLLGGALVVSRQVERDGAPVAAGSATRSVQQQSEAATAAAPSAPPPPAGHNEVMREQANAAPPGLDDSAVQRDVQAAGQKQRAIASDDPAPAAAAAPSRPSPAVVAPSRPSPKAARNDEHAGDVDSLANAPAATISAGAAAAPPSTAPAGPSSTADAAKQAHGEPAVPPVLAAPSPASVAHDEPAVPPVLAAPPPASVAHDERKPDRAGPAVQTKAAAHRATPPALYRQCEAAATRGDCVEVRRLVDQISTTDRQYRAKAAKASPIAKCLAE